MPKQTILKLRNYFKGYQSSTKRKTTTYQKVAKIGILIQAKEIKNSSAINTFVNELKSEGKSITVLCFNEKDSNLYVDFNMEQISLKDISYTGKFINPIIEDFINQSFDYLICLSLSPSPVLVTIIVASKAKCKAGLQTPSNESLFDLMVHTSKEDFKPEEIGEQIIALAKKIRTND